MPHVSFQWFYQNGFYTKWRNALLKPYVDGHTLLKIDKRVNCKWTYNGRTIWLERACEFPEIEELLDDGDDFFDLVEEEYQEVTRNQYYRKGYYVKWYTMRMPQEYNDRLHLTLAEICEGKFHVGSAGIVAFEKHEDLVMASMVI